MLLAAAAVAMLHGAGPAAVSSDVGDGALPPPYGGAAGAIVVRVGLETDLRRLEVPCCERVWVEHAGARRTVDGGFTVEPGGKAEQITYRLQVAALKDEDQARALAHSLERSVNAPARVSFDVSTSLYRVRLGRFDSRDAADRLGHRLVDRGIEGAWVVEEGGGLEHPSLEIKGGEPRQHGDLEGRWLVIEPDDARPGVKLDRGRYRGRVLVYLNDRGLLNLIDELALEDYLRGVVPVEMGPDLYDTLAALEAQAVAARTYVVRGLGGFVDEGFDICASPRCQAYGGMDAEHPLSDRAVAETSGEIVLYHGEIAEALYSASCGGSTENVEVVFPSRHADHLRGVSCPERGVTRIAAGTPAAGGYVERMVELLATRGRGASATARAGSPAAHQATIEALLARAGLPAPAGALRSLDRAEVRRYLLAALDLRLDPTVLRDPASGPGAGWSADERRLHARFTADVMTEQPAVSDAEMDEVALDVARLLGVAHEERAYFLGWSADGLEVRTGDTRRTLPLGPSVATFARSDGELRGAPLELAPGDRLRLMWSDSTLLAVASDHDGDAQPPSRPSPWTVFRRDDELRRSIATLYPGFSLRDIEVVSRGGSGRIGKLRLIGQGGATVVVEGLAVRWTLGTPETWFDLRRGSEDGHKGWVFEGRGRGHGVGLCQLGAVAMSRRGQTYKEILAHYYAGARLGRLLGPGSGATPVTTSAAAGAVGDGALGAAAVDLAALRQTIADRGGATPRGVAVALEPGG